MVRLPFEVAKTYVCSIGVVVAESVWRYAGFLKFVVSNVKELELLMMHNRSVSTCVCRAGFAWCIIHSNMFIAYVHVLSLGAGFAADGMLLRLPTTFPARSAKLL